MHNKILFVFCCFLSYFSTGQKFATSPFSSFGVGEIGSLDHATFSGIGHVNVAVIDSLSLNYFNPSSYSFLANGQPLFSSGISYKNSRFSENGLNFSSNLTGINHFALAIPFRKVFGIAFGVKPYSRMGFEIKDSEFVGTDTINYLYKGNGGLNDVFTGFSVKMLNYKNNQIGIGANFSYIFGNISNERYSNISTLNAGGIEISKTQVKSFQYDLGLNYQLTLQKRIKIILAASYTPRLKLVGTKSTDLYYSTDVNNINFVNDTISSSEFKGDFSMPSNLNLGFSINFRPKVDSSYNKTKIYQVTLFGSYSTSDWSNYTSSFSSQNENYLDIQKINVGLEFIPHYNYLDRTKSIGYFNRVRYRAGYFQTSLPIQRLTKQLTDSGFTFGLSFPIISQRSVSNLNIGVTLGNKGNGEQNSLNEKYTGVNFGITIAPGTADRWFRKYKID